MHPLRQGHGYQAADAGQHRAAPEDVSRARKRKGEDPREGRLSRGGESDGLPRRVPVGENALRVFFFFFKHFPAIIL